MPRSRCGRGSFLTKWKKFRDIFDKLIISHATPKEVAQGFALGVFIAMTPTAGLHTALAFLFAAFLRQNKMAAMIGTLLTNPLTLVPFYYCTYKVGGWFVRKPDPSSFSPESIQDFFHLGGDLLIPLWIGGVIVGLVLAVISYYLVLYSYPLLRKKRSQLQQTLEKRFK